MKARVDVDGGTVHKIDGGYVISDFGGWLDGVFYSVESASLGLKHKTRDQWCFLSRMRDEVNIDAGRPITADDFKGVCDE